ncbi:MAG: hypothetical protein SH856_04265 [Flavobacteriales bacterium]|nr:hypothetical protein [Flavobacteriales bacterium]
MIAKEQLLKSFSNLPDQVSIEEILDRIVLLDDANEIAGYIAHDSIGKIFLRNPGVEGT